MHEPAPTPISAGITSIGRARVKFDFRPVMLETGQSPPRMIPGSDNNDMAHTQTTKQFHGKHGVLSRSLRLILQLDGTRRHTDLDQGTTVDCAVPQPADQNARRGVLPEKFRRPFRPVV